MKVVFHDDEKDRYELLSNAIVTKMSYDDADEVLNMLVKNFGVPNRREALRQLLYSNARLDESVKVIDSTDGKMYGMLIFCEFPIHIGSPLMMTKNRFVGEYLMSQKQLNGFCFILDDRLQGCHIDKQMLLFNTAFIETYDYVWCAVEKGLNTEKYWERLGFIRLFEDDRATFYIIGTNKKSFLDIFIFKTLIEKSIKNEENNNI